MDISNRALAMFLLAAIVVSLAGTLTSINKLGSLTPTGYASTATGTVDLTVAGSLSVTTQDANAINFGSCTPVPGLQVVINSENLTNTSGDNGICTYASIQNISARNDGTVDANVTIQASDVGENAGGGTFLASAAGTSDIAYKITNASRQATSSGGCSAATRAFDQYWNLTASATEFPLCANLTWGAVGNPNSVVTDFEIVVPENVPTQAASVTITYTANTIA